MRLVDYSWNYFANSIQIQKTVSDCWYFGTSHSKEIC